MLGHSHPMLASRIREPFRAFFNDFLSIQVIIIPRNHYSDNGPVLPVQTKPTIETVECAFSKLKIVDSYFTFSQKRSTNGKPKTAHKTIENELFNYEKYD